MDSKITNRTANPFAKIKRTTKTNRKTKKYSIKMKMTPKRNKIKLS